MPGAPTQCYEATGGLLLVLFGGVLCILSGISLATVIATLRHDRARVFTVVLVALSVWRFRRQLS
jgi:hypothetical protein